MRLSVIAVIVVVVALVASSIGVGVLWAVAGVSVVGLGVLIFFMVRADRFDGPSVLMDDVRGRIDALGSDPDVVDDPNSEYLLVKDE